MSEEQARGAVAMYYCPQHPFRLGLVVQIVNTERFQKAVSLIAENSSKARVSSSIQNLQRLSEEDAFLCPLKKTLLVHSFHLTLFTFKELLSWKFKDKSKEILCMHVAVSILIAQSAVVVFVLITGRLLVCVLVEAI